MSAVSFEARYERQVPSIVEIKYSARCREIVLDQVSNRLSENPTDLVKGEMAMNVVLLTVVLKRQTKLVRPMRRTSMSLWTVPLMLLRKPGCS